MSGFSSRFGSLLLTAAVCVAGLGSTAAAQAGLGSTAAAQKGGVRKRPKKQVKEQVLPALPDYKPAPLQPVPLDQVPAVAPHVNYEDGKLTIEAHNSTLSDVLKEVREQTGAELDIPPNANERVVADLGPGRARDVLAQLLNGTHFNYVMVGSTTDPTAIQSIVLTPRSGGPDAPNALAANRPGVPQRYPTPVVVNGTPAELSPAGAAENDADDADAADDPPTAADQADQQNPNQTPKTPEQLLQELQKQQQQIQQQQQQNSQNPPAGQPPAAGQPPQGVIPNQPPTGAAPTPTKPE